MKYLAMFVAGFALAVLLMHHEFPFYKCGKAVCDLETWLFDENLKTVSETIDSFRKCDALFVQKETDGSDWLAVNGHYIQAQTPDRHNCYILKKSPQHVEYPDHGMTNVSIFGGNLN